MDITTGSSVFLIYRNPTIPLELERLAIGKWGINYLPYGNTERYTSTRMNNKTYIVKLMPDHDDTGTNKTCVNKGIDKGKDKGIGKDMMPIEFNSENLLSRENFFHVIYGEMRDKYVMHIFNPPGNRNWVYKPNNDDIMTSYEMELVESLEAARGSDNTSDIDNYNSNDICVELITMGDYENCTTTSLNYIHMINVGISLPKNCYQHHAGKLILFRGIVYVEYRISDTNFVTLRTLADVQLDSNVFKIMTYYA
jgi:hypothetical protein